MSNANNRTFLYFAYGSNMLTQRLKERTPSATLIGIGYVQRRRLTFDKVSSDGSGKCDAEQTNKDTDRVHGVLFQINEDEHDNLDKCEGVGNGYDKVKVDVVISPTPVTAVITYIATNKANVRPYHWYKAIVIAGAVEHNLPNNYIEWLSTFPSKEDSCIERRTKNEALLF